MELVQRYEPKEAEKRIREFWEKEKIYQFNPKSKKPLFSIDTPPPTVSGKMHLGHASSYSQMDFIARYKRMRGFNLFYPFGTDDNGLPTERLIEKLKKVKCMQMERKEFVKLCLETLKEIRPGFVEDWKRLAISCDYRLFYSTINEHCQRISQWSFIELYKKGREYQKEAPTIFCPNCQTAIAQVEMKDREIDSFFNDLVFKVEGKEYLIATTRPELLPACVAVFYHPEDKRYQGLHGKNAQVPLFDYEVPILTDEKVDPQKGTGLVMCCTFGDQTDVEWYKAYNLLLRQALTKDGRLTEITGKYQGKKIKEVREEIIKDLKEKGLLKSQKPIKHTVNIHERCGTEIEILNSKQWFIKYLDIKEHLLKMGKQMNWHPQHMRYRYDHWIKGLQWDWCISRQRYFGVPFPVWYCQKCGTVKLAEEKDLPVDPLTDKPKGKCEKCGSKEFVPEKDVLDTWATSSLTPQIAIQLIKDKKIQKKLFPMSLRPQAHDIITFWLFNTVVKSHLHFDQNPWRDITIAGFVLDPHGEKMSKSKGNVIEPQLMVEKYCADALRFWAASTKLGEDIPFQEKELVAGQKFLTKLWNASKFCLGHLGGYNGKGKVTEVFDKWLLSKLNKLIKESTESFEQYEYSKTKSEVEKFFWHTFCDYYLEIVKDRLYNPEKRRKKGRESAQFTLYKTLLTILKLMAPIMPHITEELYQLGFKEKEKEKSLHLSQWPEFEEKDIDKDKEQMGDIGVEIISMVRKFKSEKKMALNEELKELVLHSKKIKDFEKKIKLIEEDLKAATKTKEIKFNGEISLSCENLPIELGIKV